MEAEQDRPARVAIIMDGNGRWAARQGLPRTHGHKEGVRAARRIIDHAMDAGITDLTLYAFSSDNWRRPAPEVNRIFWLLRAFLRLETERMRRRGIKLEVVGRRDRLPSQVCRAILAAETATAAGSRFRLTVALDYSSRAAIAEIAAAVLWQATITGSERPGDVAGLIRRSLDSARPIDLLIQTGGEKRLSDFLLWECAYAELVFTDRMWPEFDRADLLRALKEYRSRQRRYGRGGPVTNYKRLGLRHRGARRTDTPLGSAMDHMESTFESRQQQLSRRCRMWLALFMLGLVVSGVTAFPLQAELGLFLRILKWSMLQPLAAAVGLLPWISEVHKALAVTDAQFPFLAYGTDWLAFAHMVIAIAFIGPYRDPVRNKWVISFGLIACAGVIPLALIAGEIRHIPFAWRLVDCSFGLCGCVPLLFCRRLIEKLEAADGKVGAGR